MLSNNAYRFRIYPTKEQEIQINKTFGCCRFIYNRMLSDKIEYYKEKGEMLKTYPSSYKEENQFLKEVDSLALANEQLNLEKAYKNFFRDKKIGFPKFKSKKKNRLSYTTNYTNNNICFIDKNHIKIPKIKSLKIKQHRDISNYKIKSITISKTPTNKYYCSILIEYEKYTIKRKLDESKSIGLDYSIPDFYVDNNGNKARYPKYYKEYSKRLAKEQRRLSRKVLGSRNREKARIRVCRVHEKILNCRKDFIEKLSYNLSNLYDIICIESLNYKSMSRTLNNGKSTLDNGYGIFLERLTSKLEDNDGKIIKVDKWYPSSKTCHCCGYIKKDLKLNDRVWTCPNCNTKHNRDENAAINIHREGLRLYRENLI